MKGSRQALVIGTALCLVSACVLFGAPPRATAAGGGKAGRARVLRGATAWFPEHLDPQLSNTQYGWMAMYDTYVPLLTYRHAGGEAGSEIIPGLARALPKVSDGGKTYTLFLRRGLRYSNGRRVKASDFKATIERLFRVESEGDVFYAEIVGADKFWRTKRGGIAGIAANDRTGEIVIHLLEPRNEFTSLLALPFAAPVPAGTPSRDLTSEPPPATGPYVITNSKRGRGWTFARNPAWHSNGRLMPRLPSGHVDRIEMRVIHKSPARVRAVRTGRVDWTLGWLNRADAQGIRESEGARLRDEPTLGTEYFWMNTKKPPFNDVRVRWAVNYAVDSSVLRRIYGGEIAPTQQILPPGMPGYKRFVLFPHDMEKARQLLAEADPSDRDITVWTLDESVRRRAAAYYRNVLRELGFTAHLRVVKGDNYYSVITRTSTPNLDTGWSSWAADYTHPNDFFESLLASWSIWPTFNENLAQLDVPALDLWIDRLGVKRGPIPRGRYATLDRVAMALAPWVPYGTPRIPLFVSEAVPLRRVIWNPTFGADLTSFRAR